MKILLILHVLLFSFVGLGQSKAQLEKETIGKGEMISPYVPASNYAEINSEKDSVVNADIKPGVLMRSEEFEKAFTKGKKVITKNSDL